MQAGVDEVAIAEEPGVLLAGRVAVELGEDILGLQPVRGAVELDHDRDVHGDQAGQLRIGHLEGVLDPVVEGFGPVGPSADS